MTLSRQWAALFGLILLMVAPAAPRAGGTRFFRVDDFRHAPGLELRGVAVSNGGGLVPGLHATPLAGPSLPIIWKAVAAQDGTVYAAGGDPGTLLKLPAGTGGEVLLEIDAAGFTALAIDAAGHVLAGVSPGGRLLQVNDKGELLAETETGSRYIWDLLADGDGGVWIAAGDPGAVYHLPAGGPLRQILSLGHDAARCLAPAANGRVLVGTARNGRILRVALDGTSTVLFAAGSAEVVDLIVAADGAVTMALAKGAGDAATPSSPGGTSAPAPGPANGHGNAALSRAHGGGAAAGGLVARLEPDGRYVELWQTAGETPLALLARPGGSLWVGVTPGGSLRAIDAPGRVRLLAGLPVESITHLAALPDGQVVAATGGLGTVVIFSPGDGMGEVISAVHDAGVGARFGAASWHLRAGKAGQVKVAFRSGPTRRPDDYWSPWSAWHQGAGTAPSPIAPAGRYVQWRARLLAGGSEAAGPELADMEIAYLPRNHPPDIGNAQVLPAGVVLEPLPMPPGQASVPVGSPAAVALAGGNGNGSPPPMARVRRLWQPGRRTVSWEAVDADGDEIATRLLLRADGEQQFLPFAEGIGALFHVFEESRLADGGYVIRLEVSDAPGNPANRSHTVVRDTPRFIVDRTPPVIEKFQWRADGGEWVFRFMVTDAAGKPRAARLTLDDGATLAVLPEDGIEDSPREAYEVRIPGGASGMHVAVVEAADLAGNRAVERLRFTTQE